MTVDIENILKLPVDEKLEILEKIWESIQQNNENMEIPDWHRDILEDRFKKHKNDLTEGKSWEEVKKNLLKL